VSTLTIDTPVLDVPISDRKKKFAKERTPKKNPKFHVVVHNDDYNTYEHVMRIMIRVLGVTIPEAFLIAYEVDHTGQCIVYTGSLEQAELIRDQIIGHAPTADSPAIDKGIEPTRFIATLQKAPEG
jgi:ATP-dependent Clp protease adaptor protein ClpS